MLKSAAAIFFPTALGEKDLEGGTPAAHHTFSAEAMTDTVGERPGT